ncbi:VCBS domain-containing protein, partial [Shewanella sp. 10N.286.54.B9]|uniref:VCBS domain-containing protein n=1 Tax=Shewanella sp. 10N.286.54.B9 TaxID=3229719 RepID=UPI00355400E2
GTGTGTNEKPLSVDSQQQIQQVKEDSSTDSVAGSLHAQGHNSAQINWIVNQPQGQFGSLIIDPASGQWHYQLNNAALATNALAENEHHTEQFIVTATDSEGNHVQTTIAVEVEGSNDLPTISGVHHAALNEDGAIDSASGSLIAIDPDTGDNISWSIANGQGQLGELSIDPDTGTWHYQLNNKNPATQALNQGQIATETFSVIATDSSGQPVTQQVTVQITGSNDLAQIGGTSTAAMTEDLNVSVTPTGEQLRTEGQLTITDPDSGQSQFVADHYSGQYGQFGIDENGHWVYTANNSNAQIQGLKTGESVSDTLLVHSIDGTEQKVAVTINGSDDKAVIAGTSTASLTEDKDFASGNTLRADGQLTVTDLDRGENQFTADSLQGQYGQLSIDNTGHWTYTANNSSAQIQGLKTGETVTDTLLVHSVDGTEQKVTIIINGSDDKAAIAGTSTASLTEDKDLASGNTLRADGQLTVTDPDSGQSQFTADSLQGQYGQLSIDNTGHWTYTANNSSAHIQGLKTGESVTDTLLVHSVDGTEQKVTIIINGSDDKAAIAGTSTASLTEDKDLASGGTLRADGQLTVTDLDRGENQFTADSLQGQYGQLSIDNTGHWTYTANNSSAQIQGLKTGETVTDTLLVHSVDGTEQKVTIIINGSDDKAVIAGVSTASLTEDKDLASGNTLRADGQLTVIDLDRGENQFTADSLQGQYGQLSIDNTGHWTYTANNSSAQIQGLKTGESVTDTLLVHSVDGTEQKVTVTINGTNDIPVVSHISSKTIDEGGNKVTGQITATDLDHGDT